MKKKLWLAILFSAGFTFILLLRIDWKQFSLIAGRLNIVFLVSACLIFILGNLIRAMRFRQLDHTDKKLMHWWNINIFYNFMTATLPGGAGEAATAYVLKRFSMFNLLKAMRILLLGRLLDLFAMSALFLTAALQISSTTPYRSAAIWTSGILLLISLVSLIPASERYILKLLQMLPGPIVLKQSVIDKLSELINKPEEKPSHYFFSKTLFYSVFSMMAGILSLQLVLKSFGVDFTLLQSAYCYGVYMIFQIVPVQGIAGIGTQAAWWALALNVSGFRSSEAIALGFCLHATYYLFIAFMGLSFFIGQLRNPCKLKQS